MLDRVGAAVAPADASPVAASHRHAAVAPGRPPGSDPGDARRAVGALASTSSGSERTTGHRCCSRQVQPRRAASADQRAEGDMSLVGPVHTPEGGARRQRPPWLAVKPGLAGPWLSSRRRARGRSASIALDRYVRNWSAAADLSHHVVLSSRGAPWGTTTGRACERSRGAGHSTAVSPGASGGGSRRRSVGVGQRNRVGCAHPHVRLRARSMLGSRRPGVACARPP